MIQVVPTGSRIHGSKRHRIPDPDPQHWGKVILPGTYFVLKQFLYTYLRFLRKLPEYSAGNCFL
jgi:hypothetical protein